MNTSDADKQGLTDGEMVRVISARGELQTQLRNSQEVAEGELFMPWHTFLKLSLIHSPAENWTLTQKLLRLNISACRVEKMI